MSVPVVSLKQAGYEEDVPAGITAPIDNATLNASPAATLAAVVTIPAVPNQAIYIRRIFFGFSGTAPVSTLQIESPAGTVVWGPIPAGALFMNFLDIGLDFPTNQAVKVTLSAPGAGSTGGLQVDAFYKQ